MLYAGMAIAAWLVWRKRGWGGASRALSVFGLQLAPNVLWTALFFGLKAPGVGAIEIVIVFLWLAIAGTILLH
ncbi:hypothetical protein BH24CHL1_BH24CHL1_12920 [soil metagenome]